MRIKVICCLTLIMMIGSVATAQQYGPCGGPQATALANWAKFHSDLCNTGYNGNEFILSPTTVGNLVVKWQYTTDSDQVDSSPAVAKGVVYVGSYTPDNGVYALNATTGALLWKYTTGGAVTDSSPAVANGVVYVGSQDDNVYALNATNGESPVEVRNGRLCRVFAGGGQRRRVCRVG